MPARRGRRGAAGVALSGAAPPGLAPGGFVSYSPSSQVTRTGTSLNSCDVLPCT